MLHVIPTTLLIRLFQIFHSFKKIMTTQQERNQPLPVGPNDSTENGRVSDGNIAMGILHDLEQRHIPIDQQKFVVDVILGTGVTNDPEAIKILEEKLESE